MAILSKLLSRTSTIIRFSQNVQQARRLSFVKGDSLIKCRQEGPTQADLLRTVSSQPSLIPQELYPLGNFLVNHSTMPVVDIMESDTLDKLMEYSTIPPYPVSIEELIEHGDRENYTEERSFNFLKKEVAVRLAHMIMELQHLPKELQAEERCLFTIQKYSQSFKEIMRFEDMPAGPEELKTFMELLFSFKGRHSDTVDNMAQACVTMKERLNIPADDVNSLIFASIKVFLDRLYTSRIGIHMLTNQHLSMYGYERQAPHNVGIIHPNCDLTSVLVDAMDEATFHTENTYMVAPKVNIKRVSHGKETEVTPLCHLVPSHLFIIFNEIMKNAMRATVEHHWDNKDDLPPLSVTICHANDDFTIKISDQGGGMDRESASKCFFYQYSTVPKYCDEKYLLGYGLPLARLYSRYFNGDLKVASYEGYGTDVYIYTRALANKARERLPIYNKESVESWSWFDSVDDDWTSGSGTVMMQPSDMIADPQSFQKQSIIVEK